MNPSRLSGGLALLGVMACAEAPSAPPLDASAPEVDEWSPVVPAPDASAPDAPQPDASAPDAPQPDASQREGSASPPLEADAATAEDAAPEDADDDAAPLPPLPAPMSPTSPPRAPLTVRDARVRPLAPLSGSTVGSSFPTLQWTATDGPVTLELCRNRAMWRGCRPPRVVRGDSARVADAPLPPGQWFWRVRPESGSARGAPVWQLQVPHGDRRGSPDTSFGVGTDFDGDGFSDLPYRLEPLGSPGNALSVHYGAPPSVLPRVRAIPATEALPGADLVVLRRVGDVDGDGFADVAAVAAGRTPPRALRVLLLRGSERGLLEPEVGYTVTGLDGFVELRPAGDVDRDGYADVILSVGGDAKVLRGGREALRGVFAPRVEAEVELTLVEGAADFDGDGLNDLLARRANGDWHAVYGTADGGLRWDAAPLFAERASDWGSFAKLLGDTDGDGRSDVATGFQVRGYHGSGTTIRLHRAVAAGDAPEVALDARYEQPMRDLTGAGDLDADGRDEVYYLTYGSYAGTPYPTVVWGAARGAPLATSAAPSGEPLAAVGDFDGDGVGDWAYVAERTDAYRSVLGRWVQVARGEAGDRRLLAYTALGGEVGWELRVTPVR